MNGKVILPWAGGAHCVTIYRKYTILWRAPLEGWRVGMSRIIHARIDPETEKLLAELQIRLGWSDSRIVREGIKALGVINGAKAKRKIAGVGRFRSGVPDLGSNEEHLKGFGR